MNLKGMDRGIKPVKKRSFLNSTGLFLSARENILQNFKSKIFPTTNLGKIPTPKPAPVSATEPTPDSKPDLTPKSKPDPTIFVIPEPSKAKTKNSPLKLQFWYQNLPFLENDLDKANQDKNDK